MLSPLLLLIPEGFTQSAQLGSGTATNSIYQSSPVNIWYRRTVSQFVYTAAEINAAGVSGSRDLTSMGFYVTNNPLYNIPGYTIKIKHTTQTNVSSALGTTGWTTVKNAFTYAPTPGGYDMIVFDTPFTWDGVSNIGVEICWSQVSPNYNASGQCRIYSTNNGYRYRWTDAGGSSCGTTPNSRNSNKPQAQLTFFTTTQWNGSVSSDWFNAANWDAGVPDITMDAVIPSTASNMPNIYANGAVCKDVVINSGATLTITDAYALNVYGDWTNNGTFVYNSSTVEFNGKTNNQINCGGTQGFYNLYVNSENGAQIASGSYDLYGTLDIQLGTFNTGNAMTLISNAGGTAISSSRSVRSWRK